jgi:diguanylate cyclase (GGDEF)-like protein/PAS domain S-box-containing protein
MFRVLTCLTGEHDWRLVVLAGLVCFLASLTAINLLHRARATHAHIRALWIVTAGATTGCGIWATHFVAMLAYEPGIAVGYDLGLTALSLIAAIAVTSIGLAFALYFSSRWSAALGGSIVGAGVASMHYLGMWAVQLPGRITWWPDLVVASIILGMAFGAAALALATRRNDLGATVAAAILLTLAIVSHHFTAMGAVEIVPDPARTIDHFSLSPTSLAWAIANAAIAVLGMSLAGAFADRRLREKDRRIAIAVSNMSQGLVMFDADERLMVCNDRYIEMYGLSREVVKPGCTLRDVIRNRLETGSLDLDPEQYRAELLEAVAKGQTLSRIVETGDGRSISIVNQPIAGGDWVGTHEDITKRRLAERELERTKTFLNTVIENVPATIVVKQLPDFRYALVNRAGERYFNVPREKMLGKTAADIFSPELAKEIAAEDAAVIQSGRAMFFDEHPFTTPDGTRIVTANRLPIYENGEPKYLLVVVNDVTARKRAEARIAHMAHHDALTDLPNRTAFTEHLAHVLDHATIESENFAVVCVDLDRFKEVNDVFGHAVGDALLKEVAKRLEAAAQGAFIARLGGDEFALIAADGPQPASAEALGNRLLAAVAEDIPIEDHQLRIGLSVGVAIFPADAKDSTTLLADADAALYRAKADARGSMRFFEPDMDERLRERRALQHDLRSALVHDELALHYQPQALIGGEIIGFEALVRWHHPTRGMVSPGTFIPVAEESGSIIEIGEWILREACREAASWPHPLQIAINLSPVQFRHGDLAALVHSVLLETGLAAQRLELEITEGVLIGDFARALSILRRLKALGVRIAMDDFGTGYSSLSYLQSFPFDKIKIDQAFISNVEKSDQSAAIVRAVIGLGRGLHLPVVAEGVETADQLEFLLREDCNEVQGFLIGRPLPIEHYGEFVGRTSRSQSIRAAAGE